MSELYERSKKELEDHLTGDHGLILTVTELYDIWEVATRESRKEIRRLERLVQFQIAGRIQDCEARKKAIAELGRFNP